jgi:hypothetical protein
LSLNLRVIGAGLGRTGTTSLKRALEILLGGPCFHFLEYESRPELMEPWRELVEEMPLRSDPDAFEDLTASRWEAVMPGYVACVDEPAAYYWKQLSRLFPEALVILSIRDNESWWSSMLAIEQHHEEELKHPERLTPERRRFLEFTDAIYPEWNDGMSKEIETNHFIAHNRRVVEHAKQDESFRRRLLIWRAEDGWAPICRALDVPTPDLPFPHENKRAEYHGY